jgi:hypothetical protein
MKLLARLNTMGYQTVVILFYNEQNLGIQALLLRHLIS